MGFLITIAVFVWLAFIMFKINKEDKYKKLEKYYEIQIKEKEELKDKLYFLKQNPGKKEEDYYEWKSSQKAEKRKEYLSTLNEEEKEAFLEMEKYEEEMENKMWEAKFKNEKIRSEKFWQEMADRSKEEKHKD